MLERQTLIIYTDLDGTLLDEETYSFESARPALDLLRSQPVYLVPCTSKTREEFFPIQGELGFRHPFIVENGGAIYLPGQLFGMSVLHRPDYPDWIQIELGVPYPRLVDFLSRTGRELGLGIIGFHDLDVAEIAAMCGLSLDQACRAKTREYDEPFLISSSREDAIQVITSAAGKEGLTITRGGRFYHLAGGSDKGQAVTMLTRLFQLRFGHVFTVGIGDSPNDLPMLAAVDLPVVVERPNGRFHPDLLLCLPGARQAPGVGPRGWNLAISEILAEIGYVTSPSASESSPAIGSNHSSGNYEA